MIPSLLGSLQTHWITMLGAKQKQNKKKNVKKKKAVFLDLLLVLRRKQTCT